MAASWSVSAMLLDRVVEVGFVQVPGRKCPAQPLRTTDRDFAGAKHIAPRSGAPVPVDERPRAGLNGEVSLPAGIGVAHLGIAVLDQYPEPSIAGTLFRKGESDHDSAVGQVRSVELYLAPGPQRVGGIGLF